MENPYPCLKLDKLIYRRKSDPQIILQTWNAINCALRDNQPSNAEVLLEYVNSNHEKTFSDVSLNYLKCQLDYGLGDGLLIESLGSYDIPVVEEARVDGHDWYCFQCHLSGHVILCKSCWRVYHPMCIQKHLKSADLSSCLICQSLQKRQKSVSSQLLAFVLIRLKIKTNPLYNLRNHSDPILRALPMLLYEVIDLDTIKTRITDDYYSSVVQFEHDVYTLCHNVSVAYGVSSDLAELAKVLLKDCQYELEELLLCSDCYFFSNSKPKDWFCYPCHTPHQLVYAKLRGFPYWPAKIIKATPNGYNVRFFGALHQRALISESFIQSIETDREKLFQRKSNPSLTKALDELDLHLKMTEEKRTCPMDLETSQIFEKLRIPLKRKLVSSSSEILVTENERSDPSSLYLSQSGANGRQSSSANKLVSEHSPTKQEKIKNRTSSDHSITTNKHSPKEPRGISSTSKKGIDRSTAQLSMLSDYANFFKQNSSPSEWTIGDLQASWCKKYMLKRNDVFLKTILDMETTFRERETQAAEALRALEKRLSGELSKTKKRQWCFNCERPAQYYCCWNTSYCSHSCQRKHWQNEHRNTCRRVHRNQGNSLDSGPTSSMTSQPQGQLSCSMNGS